jgi:hypothetical protein
MIYLILKAAIVVRFLGSPEPSEIKTMEIEIINDNHAPEEMRTPLLRRCGFWLCMIAIPGLSLLCPPLMLESFGQGKVPPRTRQKQQQQQTEAEQRTDLPKIVSVHGQGGKTIDARSRVKQTAEPPPLSAEVKDSLIKSAGVKETKPHNSFKLTPAKPSQSQGSLAFEDIAYLDPEQNFLSVTNQESVFDGARSNRTVLLFIKTAAGKKYLIDFTVTGDKFFVLADPGNTRETFSGTHHVLILYDAADAGGATIALTGTGGAGKSVWTFHSCEVTLLN